MAQRKGLWYTGVGALTVLSISEYLRYACEEDWPLDVCVCDWLSFPQVLYAANKSRSEN